MFQRVQCDPTQPRRRLIAKHQSAEGVRPFMDGQREHDGNQEQKPRQQPIVAKSEQSCTSCLRHSVPNDSRNRSDGAGSRQIGQSRGPLIDDEILCIGSFGPEQCF